MITVHIEQVGTQHFCGPDAGDAAQKWARQAMRQRECAEASDEESLSKSLKRVMAGTAHLRIRNSLAQHPDGRTAKQIQAATGLSSSTVLCMLQAYKALGMADEIGMALTGGRNSKVWKLASKEGGGVRHA